MTRRREFLLAGASAALLGAAAVGYGGWRYFGHHYPPTPYDDLFDLLPSREATALLASNLRRYGDVPVEPDAVARDLRHRLQHHSLADLIAEDTQKSYIADVSGWLLPISLVEIVWLAKKWKLSQH